MSEPLQKNLRVPVWLSAKLEELPMTKARAAKIAVLAARARPELLPMALQVRGYKRLNYADETRVSLKNEEEVNNALTELADMYGLSVQEVFRLSLEAYVNKL